MRRLLSVLCLTAAAALIVPAGAQAARYHHHRYYQHHRPHVLIHRERAAAPAVSSTAGVTAGTVAAVGTYNAWWGTGALASTLPATAVGSAAFGGVVGVGSVALVDAALQPCRGFAALFDLSHGECVNGEYIGPAPRTFYR